MQEGKINLNISDGDSFYAHQASINFNPTMIFLDFKNVTPRIDDRSPSKATLFLKHNVVMLEPYHAKLFSDLLNKVIKDYETEFGSVEKPKALQKLEKMHKGALKKKTKDAKLDVPNYFG